MTQLQAAVFDMDGILIDSEPFWFEAEREAFTKVGIDITPDLYQQTMGLRINEVVEHWERNIGWTGRTNAEIEEDVVQGVVERIHARGVMLDGVNEAIAFFRDKGLKIGLATSSYERVIEAVLETMDLTKAFDTTFSAEHEEFGKPHPAVYLSAAAGLGVEPSACVAIEDSVNGIKSAKAAGMFCIGVPDKVAFGLTPEKFDVADVLIRSLVELNNDVLAQLPLEL